MDVRWQQRLSNYKRALTQLNEAVALMSQRPLSNLEKLGVIQLFEFTHELAWKTMKDFLESKGNTEIYGSKDASLRMWQMNISLHLWTLRAS